MLKNVGLALYYVLTGRFESFKSLFSYYVWLKKMSSTNDYTLEKVSEVLQNLAHDVFVYSNANLPYGRLKWFFISDRKFNQLVDESDLLYYGYQPVRSKIEEDFHEFGLVLTQYGFFEKRQILNDDGKTYETVSKFYPLAGLWKISVREEVLLYYPMGRIQKLETVLTDEQKRLISDYLLWLVERGYTKDVENPPFDLSLAEKVKTYLIQKTNNNSLVRGVISGAISNISRHTKSLQINAMATGSQGHGHAAEYANNLIDKIKNPGTSVQQVGQNNAKYGADRLVGNQQIQTKYHYKASSTVNSAFDKAKDGGMYRYSGMQLEVPKDQYHEALEIMKQKIKAGKVQGVTDPQEAKNIIRRGNVTYRQAKLIAEGGNITSLTVDLADGVIQSLPGASISFIVIFAQAKWHGVSVEDAGKAAALAGMKTLAIGGAIHATSQQFAKVMTKSLRTVTGNTTLKASVVAGKVAPVIYYGIVITPDLFDTLRGRISSQQLLKNITVTGGGILGGTVGGALAGSVVGPVGAFVGALVGGIGGSHLAKTVMDQFIIDDRVEMFAQLKEEYIEIVMLVDLTTKEFQTLQGKIFNDKLENVLKDMFQKKSFSRQFASDFIGKEMQCILSQRSKIEESDIIEARQVSEVLFEA